MTTLQSFVEDKNPKNNTTPSILTEPYKLEAVQDILKLKARYCGAVDAVISDIGKMSEFLELLTDDVVLDYGAGAVCAGKPAVEAFYKVAMAATLKWSFHMAHNPVILITGADSATGDWNVQAFAVYKAAAAAGLQAVRGRYHEEYAKTADGWRLRKLVLTLDGAPQSQ